jgi:hypothetical protein
MKVAWIIVLISAATDAVISAGTALVAAMMSSGSATLPSRAIWLLIATGGLVAFSRTVQQALKGDSSPSGVLVQSPGLTQSPAPDQPQVYTSSNVPATWTAQTSRIQS